MKDTQPVDTIARWRQEVKMSQLTPVLHNCETNNHFLELNILLYTMQYQQKPDIRTSRDLGVGPWTAPLFQEQN